MSDWKLNRADYMLDGIRKIIHWAMGRYRLTMVRKRTCQQYLCRFVAGLPGVRLFTGSV